MQVATGLFGGRATSVRAGEVSKVEGEKKKHKAVGALTVRVETEVAQRGACRGERQYEEGASDSSNGREGGKGWSEYRDGRSVGYIYDRG